MIFIRMIDIPYSVDYINRSLLMRRRYLRYCSAKYSEPLKNRVVNLLRKKKAIEEIEKCRARQGIITSILKEEVISAVEIKRLKAEASFSKLYVSISISIHQLVRTHQKT